MPQLHVSHLNADSSFLLIFSPPFAPSNNTNASFPGSFSILLDPWLKGSCTILNKHFAHTSHTTPPSAQSIHDLPCEPDIIICSQDKPDHCHQETLEELPPDTLATILGTPAACKKIRSWNHFDPEVIQPLKRFDERKDDTLHRIRIPPFSANGSAGEVTIALLAPKRDLTGLHNGIGITYRPPSSPLSIKTGSMINLPHSPSMSNLSTTQEPTVFNVFPPTPPITPPPIPRSSSRSRSRRRSLSRSSSRKRSSSLRPSTRGSDRSKGISNVSCSTLNLANSANQLGLMREKTLSIIYSPHGVSFKTVEPYASSHLLSASALPLTTLFHAFDEISNPWYLGGTINNGSPGGIEIARRLFAKVWVGAHDEDKKNTGLGTRRTKTKKWYVDDIQRMLEDGDSEKEKGRKRASSGATRSTSTSRTTATARRTQTEVLTLDAGDDLTINADGVRRGRDDVGVAV